MVCFCFFFYRDVPAHRGHREHFWRHPERGAQRGRHQQHDHCQRREVLEVFFNVFNTKRRFSAFFYQVNLTGGGLFK